ncbi:ABC transporter permease [Aureimonas sp. SA4125]|uniref:exopolysaccharide biosynthesis protein n=1 Tax=Aureimonas sp. SA4125 TaxID=2826993 RepID=UPI001CC547E4|nr:exopolysaccharide biosynthesis protein [Aureimonas sp. SA4125]BDA85661.1 ABC transporter permease [Aureimonas sp. SA4125]
MHVIDRAEAGERAGTGLDGADHGDDGCLREAVVGHPVQNDADVATPLETESAPAALESLALSKRKLAEILVDIAEDTTRERVSVADLLLAMQDRAFGALMLIFAMPNALPTPPGTSAILGAPLVFLAAQLMFGRKPWLPKVIANRSMSRTDFAAMIGKVAPWITRAEKLLRPRLVVVARPPAEYLIGALCLLMATILILPIPLGNMLPAFTICLFSLGLLERDGIWILAGAATSIVSVVLVSGVLFALFKGAVFVFTNAFL